MSAAKQTMIVVSYGTAYEEVMQRDIVPVEEALQKAFPHWQISRAFTSKRVREKLEAHGMKVPSPVEAVQAAREHGSERICLVSLHMIPGGEYEKLAESVRGLPLSRPLLDSGEDYRRTADFLRQEAEKQDGLLLVMGHGSDHVNNAAYRNLQKILPEGVYLACLDGDNTLDTLLPTLLSCAKRRITLLPLLLTAADHVRKDMAGDAPHSWKSRLTKAGFSVECQLVGAGSRPEIQRMFVRKAQDMLLSAGYESL